MRKIEKPYFLPYQRRWLTDRHRVKLWEKSRRIGATYVQSYEDVRDAVAGRVPSVWFSSADESAAKEYILLCETWIRLFNAVAKGLDIDAITDQRGIHVYTVTFCAGAKITALSSNPKAFRSKGGKVVLDEFAFHADQDAMWAAARPCVTWGYPLRILSTHNGCSCRYYRFTEQIKKGALDWSLHSTPLALAVSEGLADRITNKTLSKDEREAWIFAERAAVGDESAWLQEYCCIPEGETTAFLPYEMIDKASRPDILGPPTGHDLFAGVDIGRAKDLTVIWTLERVAGISITRDVLELARAPFAKQRDALFSLLARPKMRRVCIDATGIGMQLAEEALTAFGRAQVEAVTFTAAVKEQLAHTLKRALEDASLLLPAAHAVREDLHSVRRVTTSAGNVRFDGRSTDGHADRFWAAALAQHAVIDPGPLPLTASSLRRESSRLLANW